MEPVITRGIVFRVRTSLTQAMTREITNHSTYSRCMSAPAQGDFTHRHCGVANIVHRELAIKCGLSHGPPMLDYKFEPQSLLEQSNCKPHCDRSSITDQTAHNNRPQIVTLDKTIKAAYSVDVAISNSHSLHNTVTKLLQIYTDFK